MQDSTAHVGSPEQIYASLDLMLSFAIARKPIHIHCYSGVGRSAMMTATLLACLYLLDDKEVKACIDPNNQLDASSEDFIEQLYEASSMFILSKRRCCHFDSRER